MPGIVDSSSMSEMEGKITSLILANEGQTKVRSTMPYDHTLSLVSLTKS